MSEFLNLERLGRRAEAYPNILALVASTLVARGMGCGSDESMLLGLLRRMSSYS